MSTSVRACEQMKNTSSLL